MQKNALLVIVFVVVVFFLRIERGHCSCQMRIRHHCHNFVFDTNSPVKAVVIRHSEEHFI